MRRQLNLQVDAKYVDELIASHSEASLSNEDLMGLQKSNTPLKDDESDEDVMVSSSPAKDFGLKSFVSVLQKVNEL